MPAKVMKRRISLSHALLWLLSALVISVLVCSAIARESDPRPHPSAAQARATAP